MLLLQTFLFLFEFFDEQLYADSVPGVLMQHQPIEKIEQLIAAHLPGVPLFYVAVVIVREIKQNLPWEHFPARQSFHHFWDRTQLAPQIPGSCDPTPD